MIFTISFIHADGERAFYEGEDIDHEERVFCELENENQLLKLKLEVHALKEQIFELRETLKEIDGGEKELQRAKAIKELRKQLRKSREISLDYYH